MSMGFGAFSVPDAHIDFLAAHPGWVHDYLDGTAPKDAAADSLPEWWPSEEQESMGGWGVNHRNADLYHWILNRSPAPVAGAGCLFQTQYDADSVSAIKLDAYNERFAFRSGQLGELLGLVEPVTVPTVLEAFVSWCKAYGKPYEDLDEYACQPFVDEFTNFADGLRDAIARGNGIIF